MTDKAAADLKIALDAMRMARAEDAKLCARLTARVAELEEEVAQLGRDRDALDPFASERAAKLAEGTRDETAARCSCCRVPAAAYDHLGRCGMCASEVTK
jgi:hypothetical protein